LTVWLVVGDEINELMDQELREAGEIIHNVLANTPNSERATLTTPGDAEYEEHLVWQIVDTRTGEVHGRSHKAPLRALATSAMPTPVYSADGAWRVLSFDFKQLPQHVLVVAQSHKERAEAQEEAAAYTTLGALMVGLLAALFLYWRMGRELSPLDRLGSQVRAYDPLKPETRPMGAERAELQPIEDAIVEMGQRLAQRITSERAFTSHAAHALRTPVAGIDAQLAVALREAPPSLVPRLLRARQAATKLGRVMQALLAMFRSGVEPQRQRTSLSGLLLTLPFPAVDVRIASDTSLEVDPDLLLAALVNLLDNAHKHHAHTVTLSATVAEGWHQLSVQDDGDGCDAAQLERMQQALEQQDYRRESGLNGLGLVLGDLVMRAHGGRLELQSGQPGFAVVLRWPVRCSS
jgi:signal transduction histidine kinase